MVELLVGDKENIDLSAPIILSKEQRERFISLLENVFDPSVIKLEETENFRVKRLGDKAFQSEWRNDEYALIFEMKSNDILVERLGRTWMSINIKRGQFMGDFLQFVSKHGFDLTSDNLRELIEKYVAEKEFDKEERAKKRKMKTKLRHEIDSMKEQEKGLPILINTGKITPEDAKRKIEERKKKEKKLEELEDE